VKHLKTLNKYLWKYKWHLGLGLVFIIVSDLYGVWAQIYVRQGIDAIAGYTDKMDNFVDNPSLKSEFYDVIIYCILLFLAFNLIKGFFLFCQRQTIIVMSRRIEYDLKNSIYKHYQELPVSFYQKGNTGDIMNRISEDVGKVRMYLGPGIMYTINLIVLLSITITQMFQVNVELTVYVLLPLPIMGWLVFTISKRINKKSTILQTRQSELSTRVQEDFTAIRLIKTFGKKLFASKKFSNKTDEYKESAISLLRTDASFIPVMTVLVGLSTVLTICVGGMLCIDGKITIGNIGEFVIYVNMLTWPFASVGWISSLIQRAAASQERINEFMDEKPYTEKLYKGNTIEPDFTFIEFENVAFHYPGSTRQALQHISFSLPKGKTLGIIGKTGSGKTTIGNLLNAEHTAYTGTIRIGKNELSTIALHDLRNKISCVPQDAFLFSDTIKGNIAFGSKTGLAELSIIKEYAKKAVVHENIMGFDKQYDTVVGERGITLSGGQKQRITIARSLIREPEILLFDDCLSAVDAETEKEILGNLVESMRGKTTLLISHRVSTVMHADEIIVLDEGKIIERGTHAQLIKNEGLYQSLYTKQSGNN
jgi:ATP-binding cassette subfamily B multidrug efflux pump